MAGPRRGLRDVRTMSDLLSETSNPQRKFLKLAMLAMEKARRGKERKSARLRIEDIDSRLAEIEAESEGLRRLVGVGGSGESSDTSTPPPQPKASHRSAGGFKLRY
mgnify:FL=1